MRDDGRDEYQEDSDLCRIVQYRSAKLFRKYVKQHFEIDERAGLLIHRNKREDDLPIHVYRLKDLVFRVTSPGTFKIQATSVQVAPTSRGTTRTSATDADTTILSSSSGNLFLTSSSSFSRKTFFVYISDLDVANLWRLVLQRHGAQELLSTQKGGGFGGSGNHGASRTGSPVLSTSPFSSDHWFLPSSEEEMQTTRLRIEMEDVRQWRVADVQDFLTCLRLPPTSLARGRRSAKERTFSERYGKTFLKNDVNGRVLIDLDNAGMQAIGILLQQDRMALSRRIRRLRETRVFDINEHFVLQKLEEMEWSITLEEKDEDLLCLVRRDQLRPKYFHFDAIDRETIQEYLNIEKQSDSKCFSISALDDDSFDLMSLGTGKLLYLNDDDDGDELPDFCVGLVALCFSHSCRRQSNKAILLPTAGHFPSLSTPIVDPEDNGGRGNSKNSRSRNGDDSTYMTPAVVFGPWLLQWSDSCLLVPKRMVHSMTLIQRYVQPLKVIPRDQIEDAIEKVVGVIVNWNAHMLFSRTPNTNDPVMRTPMQFVIEVLKTLGIDPPRGDYWNDMRRGDIKPFSFRPSNLLRDANPKLNGLYNFRTHAAFDRLVYQLDDMFVSKNQSMRNIHENHFRLRLDVDFPDDFFSLRYTDLAFWLHYYSATEHKEQDADRYLPEHADDAKIQGTPISSFSRCPFGYHPVYHYLRTQDDEIDIQGSFPDWCPLKE